MVLKDIRNEKDLLKHTCRNCHNCIHVGALNLTQDYEEAQAELQELYPVEIFQSILNGSFNDPNFDITNLLPSGVSYTDPQFFSDNAVNVSSTLQVCDHVSLQSQIALASSLSHHLWCERISLMSLFKAASTLQTLSNPQLTLRVPGCHRPLATRKNSVEFWKYKT